jgi:hypothetical protein
LAEYVVPGIMALTFTGEYQIDEAETPPAGQTSALAHETVPIAQLSANVTMERKRVTRNSTLDESKEEDRHNNLHLIQQRRVFYN